MDKINENLEKSIAHVKSLHDFFKDAANYTLPLDQADLDLYLENVDELVAAFSLIDLEAQIYSQPDRQMILADVFEYVLLGRGFYAMGKTRGDSSDKEAFIRGTLRLVNVLMTYESVTVNVPQRNRFLDFLAAAVVGISAEPDFAALRQYAGPVGTPTSNEPKAISKYFDKLLPKTAGGLWHELLVYAFLIRYDLGYVMPLLLHQRLYSKEDHVVPPDFLLLAKDKRIFGVEVGRKKEIQSGSFSLKTAIPTASVDTENSRNSDRCPLCQKWINLCPVAIDRFSDFQVQLNSKCEIKCLRDCNQFDSDQIARGDCKYSKYSRKPATRLPHTQHAYANGLHYHYKCVLGALDQLKAQAIVAAEDATAIKTHLPYYAGLEDLMPA